VVWDGGAAREAYCTIAIAIATPLAELDRTCLFVCTVRGHWQTQPESVDAIGRPARTTVWPGSLVVRGVCLCLRGDKKEAEERAVGINPLTHPPSSPCTSTDTQQTMITLRRLASRPHQQHHLVSASSRGWSTCSRSSSSRIPPPCARRRPLQAASALPTSTPTTTLHRLLLLQPCKRSFSQSM
jgi:hypothetical protein